MCRYYSVANYISINAIKGHRGQVLIPLGAGIIPAAELIHHGLYSAMDCGVVYTLLNLKMSIKTQIRNL